MWQHNVFPCHCHLSMNMWNMKVFLFAFPSLHIVYICISKRERFIAVLQGQGILVTWTDLAKIVFALQMHTVLYQPMSLIRPVQLSGQHMMEICSLPKLLCEWIFRGIWYDWSYLQWHTLKLDVHSCLFFSGKSLQLKNIGKNGMLFWC